MKTEIIIILAVVIPIFMGGLLVYSGQNQGVKTQPVKSNSFQNISSPELAKMLDQKDFFFVNVHIPYEGEIAKTDAFIPYNEIGRNLDKLPQDKNAKIVLYCRSGRMSEEAAVTLTQLGYTNTYNHTGGMIDWESQGYNLLKR